MRDLPLDFRTAWRKAAPSLVDSMPRKPASRAFRTTGLLSVKSLTR
jgi:hypothetical protein